MKLRSIFLVSSLVLNSGTVFGHGALSFPESRQWLCASANGADWNGKSGVAVCDPNLFPLEGDAEDGDQRTTWHRVYSDWSGIAQGAAAGWSDDASYADDPRAKHIAIMGGETAPICSANVHKFRALDETLWAQDQGDNVYPVNISSGDNTFTYAVSAPHKTYGKGYIDIYITKDSWNPNKALTWQDLEPKPICHHVPPTANTPLQVTSIPGGIGYEDFRCPIPESKSGQHILYAVWQRDDSAEAFYSCSDVVIDASIPPAPEKKWEVIGSESDETRLPNLNVSIDDTLSLEVCVDDMHNHCAVTTFKPNEAVLAHNWQQELAKIFNCDNDYKHDVQIGILSADGENVETTSPSGYYVYQLKSSSVNYQWRIQHHAVTPEPIESVWTPLLGNEGSAVFGAQSESSYKLNDQLNFRLWRSDIFDSGRLGGYKEAIEVPMVIDNLATWKSQYITKLNDELQAYGIVIGVLQDDDTVKPVEGGVNMVYINTEIEQSNHIEYTWLLENKGQVSPEPTPDLPEWPNGIGSYQIGSKVIRNGVTYTCTGHEGWCNQNAYDPAGVFGDGTWTKD